MPAVYEHAIVREIWVRQTPFGSPVVPLVYMIMATSSPFGGVGSTGFAAPAAMSASMSMTVTPLGTSTLSPPNGSIWTMHLQNRKHGRGKAGQ
eukprot:514927-Prymnesium_polylepis.1